MSNIVTEKYETLAQGVFAPMAPEFPDVSASDLFAAHCALAATIADTKTVDKAAQFLSLGAYVRRDYITGHSNTSLTSTSKGALSVAEGIVDDIPLPEVRSESLFGENIRETYFFFKKLRRLLSSK